jgi:hypothetical protein
MIPAITDQQIRDLSLVNFNKIMTAVRDGIPVSELGLLSQTLCIGMALEVARIEEETRKTPAWRFRNVRHQVLSDVELPLHALKANQLTALLDALDNEFQIKLQRRTYYSEPWVLLEDIETTLRDKHD